MDRKEFDNLSIKEQVEYINRELYNGCTLTKACNLIGIDRSTVRNRFKKVGQRYDNSLNRYVVDNGKTTITDNNRKAEISCDNDKTIVSKDEEQGAMKHRDGSNAFVTDKKVMKNLLELSEKHNKIMEVLTWFENDKDKANVIEVREGIKIDLPQEIDTEFRKTVRVNDIVWKQFSKFCKEHKEFKQKDLHSQALLEYIEKYRK